MTNKGRILLLMLLGAGGAVLAQQPAPAVDENRQREWNQTDELSAPSDNTPLDYLEMQTWAIPELPTPQRIEPWSAGRATPWRYKRDEEGHIDGIRRQRGQEQSLLLRSNTWNKQPGTGAFGAFQFRVSGGGGGYNPFDMTAHLDARRLMFPLPRHTRPESPGTHVAPNGQIRR